MNGAMVPSRRRGDGRRLWVVALAGICALASGCRTPAGNTELYSDARFNQRFDYNEVRRLSRQLQVGMTRIQVMAILGSPARSTPSSWIYMPKRQAVWIPAEAMIVDFNLGTYTGHRFRPIVAGEIVFE